MIKRVGLLAGYAMMAASFGLTSQAQAQNNCASIRSELASAQSGGGGGQLGAAINQQSAELARARGAYDRFQCSFGGHPQCGSIVATIGQMESNLAQMRRQQARTGGVDRNRIAELERVFATQCGPNQRQQPIRAAVPRNQGNSLLATIFGTRSQPAAVPRNYDPSRVVMPGQPANRGFDRPGATVREPDFRMRGGTYRTMCVRTSDGFYWPISFSTTRDRFDEDRGSCQAMCPGVGVELYAYRNPGQQIDAMISTQTGLPYADQEYAFAYRTEFDPANRCTPSMAMLDELRPSAGLGYSTQPSGPRVPRPSARPDMASDPETRALQASSSSFSALATLSSRDADGEEMVRVVGPSYSYFNE